MYGYKDFVPMAIYSSNPHPLDFNMKNVKRRANIFNMCLLDCVYEAIFANMKMKCQRWPEMPLILGRSGTQYVAMVTKLNCGAHLVESYCKKSNISDTNWPRYLFSSYFIKLWLSARCHHIANLHI